MWGADCHTRQPVQGGSAGCRGQSGPWAGLFQSKDKVEFLDTSLLSPSLPLSFNIYFWVPYRVPSIGGLSLEP